MKNFKGSRKIRWLMVCLVAVVLLGSQAAVSFTKGETVVAVIYSVLTVIFLLIAFAYQRGYLK
jgi:hypothetical protein